MRAANAKHIDPSARANLKWLGGAAALLLIAYATGSGFVVYPMWAVVFVMLLSRLITEISLRGLECAREVSRTEMAIGERLEVILTLKNAGSLPILWVFVEDLLPEKMPVTGERARLLTLMPGQEEKMLYQVALNRRGYHQVGPALIEAGDLFGFFRRYKTGAPHEYVIVFPFVQHLMEYDIAARRPMGPVKVSNRIFEDPTRIVGVREYAPGDPFNRIHWKTSARTGRLFSKVWEPSKVLGATVILDFHKDGYRGPDGRDRGELAVSTAASLADYLGRANEQVGLLTNGRDMADTASWETHPLSGTRRNLVVRQARKRGDSNRLAPLVVPTRKGPEQLRRILEALARVDYTGGFAIDKALYFSMQHLSRDATLLVVTPSVTDALAVMLGILRQSGFSVNVFLVNEEPAYFAAIDLLAPQGIDIYHIRSIESIDRFATRDIYY